MNFQQVYNRKDTNSVKWDNLSEVFKTDDIIPLWIADMDFKAPNEVNDAIIRRAKHGIYGYTMVNDKTKKLILNWLKNRHQWHVSKDVITFSPNVIMGLHHAIQSFTEQEDKIMIQTPVYTPFFNIIKNNKRHMIENHLIYENHTYKINNNLFTEKDRQMRRLNCS